jgi:hypothetical protein
MACSEMKPGQQLTSALISSIDQEIEAHERPHIAASQYCVWIQCKCSCRQTQWPHIGASQAVVL